MAQTKNQFLEKLEEVLEKTRANIRAKAEHLFNSGAVDPESYEDNYVLPKIILCACLLEQAEQWEPPHGWKHFREEVNNLRCF